ncbi:hypothetical protein VOLCADRAFT_102871 [Volvox carteri f. nagariensis]|uniref:C2H2-type domain-containing protein n=1 Tax=Volvox carteri f. nagariensis TaxID=3068 RepID=D8TIM2_VOLCA|nr:uncharacterized protein VOLCADRAFT_102871 [Volvox carteri f. nagariensis]EFJ52912.1 hypothetical protein VOLCADRAFT_102871 [Volvox carteri f. nagariensis]|eukprot:XP_002945917.1 hypothetical protein VOLCADRAFT_102871 [Volvox carteri f. nagariensis]
MGRAPITRSGPWSTPLTVTGRPGSRFPGPAASGTDAPGNRVRVIRVRIARSAARFRFLIPGAAQAETQGDTAPGVEPQDAPVTPPSPNKKRQSEDKKQKQRQQPKQQTRNKQQQKQGLASASTSKSLTAAPASVYVYWDLDNKYPETLDHRGLVDRLRRMLKPFGKVAAIWAYANYQTLNFVPDIWEEAMIEGMEHPLLESVPSEIRCPVCNGKFRDEEKLRNHFKQLHQREHNKRLAHKPAAKKYLKSEKSARRVVACKQVARVYERYDGWGTRAYGGRRVGWYESAAVDVLRKKRGYDLQGILKSVGVQVRPVPMGKQKADVVLQKDATDMLLKLQQKQQQKVEAVMEKEVEKKTEEEKQGDHTVPTATATASSTSTSTSSDGTANASNTPASETTSRSLPASKPPSTSPVLVLVSDDHDFEALLKMFVAAGWKTVTVSNSEFQNAQARLDWGRLCSRVSVDELGQSSSRRPTVRRTSKPIIQAAAIVACCRRHGCRKYLTAAACIPTTPLPDASRLRSQLCQYQFGLHIPVFCLHKCTR